MPTATEKQRRERFLEALAARQMTQRAWAKANGISEAHLSFVLSGSRPSRRLTVKLEQFIADTLGTAHHTTGEVARQAATAA